jgi:hypothetical protein
MRNVVLKQEPMRGVLTEVGRLLGLDLVVGEEAPAGRLAVLLLLYCVVEDILLPLALRVLPAEEKKFSFAKLRKKKLYRVTLPLKGQCHEIDGYFFEGPPSKHYSGRIFKVSK